MPGPDCRHFTARSKTDEHSHVSITRSNQATLLVVTNEVLTSKTGIGNASKVQRNRNSPFRMPRNLPMVEKILPII
jgi:hypothetical protein